MRTAKINRETTESKISLFLNLDEFDESKIETGIGFLDHMLELMAFHGGFTLYLEIDGDLHVDDHHSVEDAGICLGQALLEAIGDRKGINRYGSIRLPMDEVLCSVDLDLSNRPYFVFNGEFRRENLGTLATEMIREFLLAFSLNARMNLHINIHYGLNDHHKAEAIFKALGKALAMASQKTSDRSLTTKGLF